MRTQLREFHSPERLAEIYAKPYDHTRWDDHKKRVAETIRIATEFGADQDWYDGLDLSCGDGAILKALQANGTVQRAEFGDIVQMAEPPYLDYVGSIEDTVVALTVPPDLWPSVADRRVDLFICSETIEHLERPDYVLGNARQLAHHMVLSTPIAETVAHGNEEHYWSWEVSDIEEMLLVAGWANLNLTVLALGFYDFQVWTCS